MKAGVPHSVMIDLFAFFNNGTYCRWRCLTVCLLWCYCFLNFIWSYFLIWIPQLCCGGLQLLSLSYTLSLEHKWCNFFDVAGKTVVSFISSLNVTHTRIIMSCHLCVYIGRLSSGAPNGRCLFGWIYNMCNAIGCQIVCADVESEIHVCEFSLNNFKNAFKRRMSFIN